MHLSCKLIEKNKNQLFIENVFPRVMQLSLITVSITLIRDANLLKKQFLPGMTLQTYREIKKGQKVSKNQFSTLKKKEFYNYFIHLYSN
jgi:hypothetical protein